MHGGCVQHQPGHVMMTLQITLQNNMEMKFVLVPGTAF